jgi:hypothetical protein
MSILQQRLPLAAALACSSAAQLSHRLVVAQKGGLLAWLGGSTRSVASGGNMPPVMPAPDTDRKGTADIADVYMPE